MITKSKIEVYTTSDGTEHKSIEDAQKHDLLLLLDAGMGKDTAASAHSIAAWMITNREKVIDILTTGPKSKPTSRKINGATRKRKASIAVAAPVERSAAA